jgi:hypothetical protein
MTSTTNQSAGSSSTEKVGDSVRDEAGNVQQAATEAARDVTETAKEQVADVVSDVQHETRRLIREARDQVGQQAGQQRDQAVQGLRSLSDDLRNMAEHGSGWGAQVARHGAGWSDRAAGFLDGRELTDIMEDVRTMARRRPGRFLAGAVVAGVVAGRMTRALAAGAPGNAMSGTAADSPDYGTPGVSNGMPGAGSDVRVGADAPFATTNPPQATPTAPDPDPGAPVQPTFGPGDGAVR